MNDHETRRKIIREWMALPKDKRQDRRTGCGIRQKRCPAKRVPSQSAQSEPEISARSVPEINGMAIASRWQVVIGRHGRCDRTREWNGRGTQVENDVIARRVEPFWF